MPLHVICPGCLKRFQVSARFAGMKGPCPNCGTVISIPSEPLKLPDTGDAFRTIPQFMEFDPVLAGRCTLSVLGVLLLTFVLGCIPMYGVLRSLIGTLGLCLIAFPLTLFGYQFARDREQMFALSGEELYRRAGFAAAGYVILWIAFEYSLAATRADVFVSWLYFTAFAALAALLVHPLLAVKLRDAFLHYCIFGFSVILLRFFIGFGWFWQSSALIRYSTAPPPPFLPGM